MIIFRTLFESEMGGIKDLLVLLGKEKKVKEIDAEYQRRKFLGPWGLKELARLYQDISEDKLKEASWEYCRKNLLKGIGEFSVTLKERGFLVGALSSNPQFMMDIVKDALPLDFVIGTQLEFREGMATGLIHKEVNRYTKAEILKRKRKEYGLNHKDVITIGRATTTHLPMTRESGIFIGFDPRQETIEDIAQIIVEKQEK